MANFKTKIGKETAVRIAHAEALFSNDDFNLTIDSASEYSYAADLLKVIKVELKAALDAKKDLTQPLNEAKQKIIDEFKPFETLCKAVEKHIKDQMIAFQEKAEEAAKQAQEESAREKACLRKDLEKQLMAAMSAGDNAKADEIMAQIGALQSDLGADKVKEQGVSTRETWTWELVSITDLVSAASAGKVPLKVITVNETELNKMVKAQGDGLNIPGIKTAKKSTIVIRSE